MNEDLKTKSQRLQKALQKNVGSFTQVIKIINKQKPVIFDLTEKNQELLGLDLNDQTEFEKYIFENLYEEGVDLGIGRYDEDRIIYRRSPLFAADAEPRSVHLGIDLWTKAGTEIFAPLDSRVHSFNNNANYGDYGPTIILEHELEGIKFFTLYGHLSLDSLSNLFVGKEIKANGQFAKVGEYEVNGNWPSHLHFQIIVDMLDKEGDFFGVCRPSEREYFLALCPDPNLILHLF